MNDCTCSGAACSAPEITTPCTYHNGGVDQNINSDTGIMLLINDKDDIGHSN